MLIARFKNSSLSTWNTVVGHHTETNLVLPSNSPLAVVALVDVEDINEKVRMDYYFSVSITVMQSYLLY